MDRKKNYKKGIDIASNRKKRSRASADLGRERKRIALQKLRSNTCKEHAVETKPDSCEKKYTGSAKEKLIAFYTDHNQSKLGDVDKTLAKYAGKEEQLFMNLAKRYDASPSIFGDAPTTETGAFKSNSNANNTFSSVASTRAIGFGSFSQTSKGKRSTITSLKSYTEELRASSASEDMECD